MLSKLTAWLVDAFQWALNLLLSFLVELFNLVILALGSFLTLVVSMFPTVEGSIPIAPTDLVSMGNSINWFMPVSTFVVCTVMVGSAYLVYFAIRPLLKLVQLT